ncbi:MAG: hypothetical protein KME23_26095 [Goleter apudmare HA4340-LM2]|nr:hypothetical protein [Goleter apudmare HA4340-LM2]
MSRQLPNTIPEKNPTNSIPKDPLIARGLQREQYIGITTLLLGLILVVGFLSRRFEYALLFALSLSMVLIVFLLMV